MITTGLIILSVIFVVAMFCDIFYYNERKKAKKNLLDGKYKHHYYKEERRMNKKGFTMIELLISMFILGFVLLAMGSHIGLVFKTTLKDKQINSGAVLLQDKMENFKQATYSSIVTGSDTAEAFGITYTRNWAVSTVSNNIKRVRVDVTWNSGSVSGETLIAQ